MALEGDPTSSTFYIDDLNATYPAGSEAKSQGDDHLRLIKKAIKNTFPNVDAPITATDTELNYVDVTTLGTQEASKALTADANNTVTVPSGGEINFASGAELQIAGVAVTSSAAELNVLDGIPVTLTATELGYVDGVTSAIQTQIDGVKVFGIQFNLKTVANGDYVLDEYASFGYTINTAVYDLSAGTCSIAVKIGGTAVTGLSALSVTSSQAGPTSATAANTVSANGRVTITISSTSSATDLSLKLKCTRT